MSETDPSELLILASLQAESVSIYAETQILDKNISPFLRTIENSIHKVSEFQQIKACSIYTRLISLLMHARPQRETALLGPLYSSS